MSQRLVMVSDVSGSRQDKWITTYLAAFHPHFEITYYDLQELGKVSLTPASLPRMREQYENEGWALAERNFLKAEEAAAKLETIYLGFGLGSKLIWNSVAKGLHVKSLWLVSSPELGPADHVGLIPSNFYFGEQDKCEKSAMRADDQNRLNIVPHFGSSMYMDEEIAFGICQDLIEEETSLQSA